MSGNEVSLPRPLATGTARSEVGTDAVLDACPPGVAWQHRPGPAQQVPLVLAAWGWGLQSSPEQRLLPGFLLSVRQLLGAVGDPCQELLCPPLVQVYGHEACRQVGSGAVRSPRICLSPRGPTLGLGGGLTLQPGVRGPFHILHRLQATLSG